MDFIAEQIKGFQPWITKFSVLGREYGGHYDALNDDRVSRLPQFFPNCRRVLEVGSLEGAHTVILSRAYPLAEIVGIEGRQANVDKAKFLTGLHGCRAVNFVVGDLETLEIANYGKFDLCVNLGLLYHLVEPWKFLARAGAQCDAMWLWTVYCPDTEANTTQENYRGRVYVEGPLDHGLSALRPTAFFPTLGSLCQMVRDAGYVDLRLMNFEQTPNGPSVLMVCTKTPFR